VECDQVRQLHGIGADEQLMVSLYISESGPAAQRESRPDPDVRGKISALP
jgi:hypothetical protein